MSDDEDITIAIKSNRRSHQGLNRHASSRHRASSQRKDSQSKGIFEDFGRRGSDEGIAVYGEDRLERSATATTATSTTASSLPVHEPSPTLPQTTAQQATSSNSYSGYRTVGGEQVHTVDPRLFYGTAAGGGPPRESYEYEQAAHAHPSQYAYGPNSHNPSQHVARMQYPAPLNYATYPPHSPPLYGHSASYLMANSAPHPANAYNANQYLAQDYSQAAYFNYANPYGFGPSMAPFYPSLAPGYPSFGTAGPFSPQPVTPNSDTTQSSDAYKELKEMLLKEKDERLAREEQLRQAEKAALAKAEAEKKIAEDIAAAAKAAAAAATTEAEKKAAEAAAKEAEKTAAAAEEAKKKADAAIAAAKKAATPPEKKKPIKFKDAIGRKFSFPYHLCSTWRGMEELIRSAFHQLDLASHIEQGRYDLKGPNGEIILPGVWETTIEPDWTIEMHMWPLPEPPLADAALPPLDDLNIGLAPPKKASSKKQPGILSALFPPTRRRPVRSKRPKPPPDALPDLPPMP